MPVLSFSHSPTRYNKNKIYLTLKTSKLSQKCQIKIGIQMSKKYFYHTDFMVKNYWYIKEILHILGNLTLA